MKLNVTPSYMFLVKLCIYNVLATVSVHIYFEAQIINNERDIVFQKSNDYVDNL